MAHLLAIVALLWSAAKRLFSVVSAASAHASAIVLHRALVRPVAALIRSICRLLRIVASLWLNHFVAIIEYIILLRCSPLFRHILLLWLLYTRSRALEGVDHVSISYFNSTDAIPHGILVVLLLLAISFHRINVIFLHYGDDVVGVGLLVLDEEGPAATADESTNLTSTGIDVTRQVAFIAGRPEDDLCLVLILHFFVSLVYDVVHENVIEVSLAVVTTNDQDLGLVLEQRYDCGQASCS